MKAEKLVNVVIIFVITLLQPIGGDDGDGGIKIGVIKIDCNPATSPPSMTSMQMLENGGQGQLSFYNTTHAHNGTYFDAINARACKWQMPLPRHHYIQWKFPIGSIGPSDNLTLGSSCIAISQGDGSGGEDSFLSTYFNCNFNQSLPKSSSSSSNTNSQSNNTSSSGSSGIITVATSLGASQMSFQTSIANDSAVSTKTGFILDYQVIAPRTRHEVLTDDIGIIQSPLGDDGINYPNGITHTWLIRLPGGAGFATIALNLTKLDIEQNSQAIPLQSWMAKCTADGLLIYDSAFEDESKLLTPGVLCGESSTTSNSSSSSSSNNGDAATIDGESSSFTTTSNVALVVFYSNYKIAKSGFTIEYKAIRNRTPSQNWPLDSSKLFAFWPLSLQHGTYDLSTYAHAPLQQSIAIVDKYRVGPFGDFLTSSAKINLMIIDDQLLYHLYHNRSMTIAFYLFVQSQTKIGQIMNIRGSLSINYIGKGRIRLQNILNNKESRAFAVASYNTWTYVALTFEASTQSLSIFSEHGLVYAPMPMQLITDSLVNLTATANNSSISFGENLDPTVSLSCVMIYLDVMSPIQVQLANDACRKSLEGTPSGQSRLIPAPDLSTSAKPGQFPWIASLRRGSSSSNRKHVCSASIIADAWLITSTSCIASGSSVSEYDIVAAEFDTGIVENFERWIPVRRFIRHKLGCRRGVDGDDVTLIELSSPLNFSNIYLNTASYPTYPPIMLLEEFLEASTNRSSSSIMTMVAGWNGIGSNNGGQLTFTVGTATVLLDGNGNDFSKPSCGLDDSNSSSTIGGGGGALYWSFQPSLSQSLSTTTTKTTVNCPSVGSNGSPLMITDPFDNKRLTIIGLQDDAASTSANSCSKTGKIRFRNLIPLSRWLSETISCVQLGLSSPFNCPIR